MAGTWKLVLARLCF